MNWKQPLVATAILFASALLYDVRAQEPSPKGNVKIFEIKGSYGTLIYIGKVQRTETEKEHEYLIERIDLHFDPTAKVNPTKEIAAKQILISVTKKPADGKGPYKILHRDKKDVTIVLTAESPTGTLEKIRLAVPKTLAEQADHVGLSLTDGKMLWPIKMAEQSDATARR